MKKLLECVPNFSEGRNKSVIDKIAQAISSVEGVKLLNVAPGYDANRTVMTFAGQSEGVAEAAFRAVKTASELIDMRKHQGKHPRMGATDVCPFIPVSGISMEEVVELSKQVGRRIGEQLRIPIYLYELSATKPERRKLADIRKGQYEGLKKKLEDPEWKPDFGPAEFNPKAGATVIGARNFLIAYNVNLNTTDVSHAKKIAKQIREKPDGSGLPAVRAIGWEMPQYGCVQISMNMVNYHKTPPHIAFEKIRALAQKQGLRVTGSELVGLIPLEAVLMAGRYYLEKQGKSPSLPEEQIIQCAIHSLGLNDVVKFNPDKQILEKAIEEEPLSKTCIAEYLSSLSSDSPSPGGGSAAAVAGAIACSLLQMVCNIGYKKAGASEKHTIAKTGIKLEELKKELIRLSALDEESYKNFVKAMKLPSKTQEQKNEKQSQIKKALKASTEIPLQVMETSLSALKTIEQTFSLLPSACSSDTFTAIELSRSAFNSAGAVVRINLKERQWIEEEFYTSVSTKAENMKKDLSALADKLTKKLNEQL